jgi:Na+(H+)/acetate symporter ActP
MQLQIRSGRPRGARADQELPGRVGGEPEGAIFFALQVPQTGILLTLAFDLMLAGLVVPFVLRHYWSRITTGAATAAIVVGVGVRLVLFALTPTMDGVENPSCTSPTTPSAPASTAGRRSSPPSAR